MKKHTSIYSILAGAALLTLAACTTDDAALRHAAADGTISFTATTAQSTPLTRTEMPMALSGYTSELWLIPQVAPTEAANTTRGTRLTPDDVLPAFGISAYLQEATGDVSEKTPDYFYNLKAVRSGDTGNRYGFDRDYYWPASSEALSFMAYYPYNSGQGADDDNTLLTLSPKAQAGVQQITFNVAAQAADQVDFLTATALRKVPSTTGTPAVNLNFRHQLTAVRFVVGSQFPTQGYIQKIELLNVYKQGVYSFSEEDDTDGTWADKVRGDFVVNYTADRALTGEVGQEITPEGDTFLMIPNDFPAEDPALIRISFWDGYATHQVTSSLAGTSWQPGKTVTYQLSSEKLTLLKVKNITFAATPATAPHPAWQSGDKVGLYVVHGVKTATDPDDVVAGKTLRYKNIPVTYDGTSWTVDNTTDQGKIFMYPGDSYYFYYPYKEGNPTGYPNECNELGATAETFFSSVINARNTADPSADSYSLYDDQGSTTKFVAADLQVAKAVIPSDDNSELPASTIRGVMARQVGLAQFQMATSHETPVDIVYQNNTLQSNTPKVTVAPTTTFVGNQPCLNGNYWFFTKVGSAAVNTTDFNGDPTSADKWTETISITISEPGATNTTVPTAHSVREDWTCTNSTTWNYSYNTSKTYYTWTAPETGNYTMECWGAQGGGNSTSPGGKGAYTKGEIEISNTTNLFVYVGQAGNNVTDLTATNTTSVSYHDYTWNVGYPYSSSPIFNNGFDTYVIEGKWVCAGGGATDIRVTNGVWNNTTSLASRIMVAAGGGGANFYSAASTGDGIAAGAYTGYDGSINGTDGTAATGGTQNKGGKHGTGYFSASTTDYGLTTDGYAAFGQTRRYKVCASGGGSGWYCGGNGAHGESTTGTGAGGSSYVSGHTDCAAAHATYVFSNTQMIDGKGKKWTDAATSVQTTIPGHSGYTAGEGHTGNGYARITLTH